jgi:hypothetical protein
MTEPIESPQLESEESEALSVANELAGDDWQVEEGGLGDDSSASFAAAPGGREVAPAVAQPVPPGVTAEASLTLDQVRQRWQQNNMTRAALRGELEKQYAERQKYEDMANAILRAQQAQQQPVQPQEPPQIDPELQRYFDNQQQQFEARLQGMLAPVLSQAQQAQQTQQVQQQVSQEQQQWGEFRSIVESAEQDYMATPEGQGYVERVSGFETALRKTCEYAGLSPQVSQKLVNEDMKGMAVLAMSLNIPPPVFVDAYARAMYEWAQGQGGNGNGRNVTNGNRQVQQRQQGRVSPQVQIARMATQAGAVGAPPSGGMVQSGGTVDVGTLLQRGLTGRDQLRLTRFPNLVLIAGNIAHQEFGGWLAPRNTNRPFHLRRRGRNADWPRPGRVQRPALHDHIDMMHQHSISRPDFSRLNPPIFGESAGKGDVHDVDDTFSRNLERVGHLHDGVGLSNVPAFGELTRLWRLSRVSFSSALIDPCDYRVNFLLAQGRVVLEVAVLWIGEPRRHFLGQHRAADGLRPRPRLGVGEQRHRSDFSGSMALLTTILDDRRYIF